MRHAHFPAPRADIADSRRRRPNGGNHWGDAAIILAIRVLAGLPSIVISTGASVGVLLVLLLLVLLLLLRTVRPQLTRAVLMYRRSDGDVGVRGGRVRREVPGGAASWCERRRNLALVGAMPDERG
jgi:hypothetical protein